ncbi:histidine kinase [Thermomicrobium sp. 4228-Ro]|uniref:sensor histidine kinase n=1 Tax=Thermomicrobium sp. 4228-Ro TaxID=2993937 RepID=UPI00224898CE|nr:GAF domain-containing protein [Thermomicrobium sp. 4228-Ro]MCX2726590.1 histidine kinase [Thermomicrobium sp. 4228-Ro]
MTDGRLRWLTRGKARAEPVTKAGERPVPSWLEHFIELLGRTAPDALDWQAVAAALQRAVDADLVRIWRVVPERQLRLVVAQGLTVEPIATRPFPLGFERLGPREAATGRVSDIGVGPLLSTLDIEEFQRDGVRQLLVLPLAAGDRIVGRLDVGRYRDEPFAPDQRTVASLLAPLLALELLASERQTTDRAWTSTLLAEALASVSTARESLVRVLEVVRWRTRADAALLVRWAPGDRPELLVTQGDASLFPDPAALATTRVTGILRGVLERGRGERLSEADGIGLLFPQEVASVIAVPLPVIVERARGLVLVVWRRADPEAAEEGLRALEGIAPALVGLLAWLDAEERASTARSLTRRYEEALTTLIAVSEPSSVSAFLWSLVSREPDAVASALVLRDGDRLLWFWVGDGATLPVRSVSLAQDLFGPLLRNAEPVRLGDAQREQWQSVVPEGVAARSLLVVPLGSGTGALVLASAREEPTANLEQLLRWLAALVEPARADLVRRARSSAEPDRRGQALLDALAVEEDERRRLVETIHTNVLQGLASTLYRIELTLRRADQQPLEQTVLELEQVRDRLAEHIATLRDTIFRLRPASLDHLGLVAALRDFVTQLERTTGITIEFFGDVPERPTPDLEEKLYRITQTLIERARLPVGITRLVVRVRQQRDGAILLVIADDGKWAGYESWVRLPSVALVEEWVRVLGGTIRATGLPEGGTAVAISIRPDVLASQTRVPIGTNR